MKMCAFDGCPNLASPKATKGLCNSHYWQLHNGRPLTPLAYRRNVMEPWLLANVDHQGDECLIWPFKPSVSGYGQVKHRGTMIGAHRLMCIMAHGEPPTPEHQAAHSCGKGHLGCVNPGHLRWATEVENKMDMVRHGAGRKPRLTERQVFAIREFSHNVSRLSVASMFSITAAHADRIIGGRAWRHI